MYLKRLFFVMMFFITLSAFAQNRVIDNAGLLSAEQKARLEERIASVAAVYHFDLVIVTEKYIGTFDPGVYADDFFDSGGYGQGANRDGCIFLQTTESRDYSINPSGRGYKGFKQRSL